MIMTFDPELLLLSRTSATIRFVCGETRRPRCCPAVVRHAGRAELHRDTTNGLAPGRLVQPRGALRACQPRPRAEKIRMPLQQALGERTVARAAERLIDHGEGTG